MADSTIIGVKCWGFAKVASRRFEESSMPTLELTDQQVVELVKQLPPDRKREALMALAASAAARREERLQYAEAQLRRLSAERGQDWDKMSEDERESFLDDLIHEDRPCRT
jgi:hypothetical protein